MCFKPNMKVLVVVRCSYFCFHFVHCYEIRCHQHSSIESPLIYDDFDLKLQEFKWRMMVQVVGILMPLFAFSMVYNHSKA